MLEILARLLQRSGSLRTSGSGSAASGGESGLTRVRINQAASALHETTVEASDPRTFRSHIHGHSRRALLFLIRCFTFSTVVYVSCIQVLRGFRY